MPIKLAVVIPARDESLRLPATLHSISAARGPLADRFEIVRVIVADNGSHDGTAYVALDLGARLGLPLKVWSYGPPGKARTLATAMPRAANGVDAVLFMDADNATDISELVKFSFSVSEIGIASRYTPGARIFWPDGDSLPRRLMSRLMRGLSRRLLGLPLADTQCGFKLFPAALVAPLFGSCRSHSWVFDAELLALAHRAGVAIREYPVSWTAVPGSKVSAVRDAPMSLAALLMMGVSIRIRPTAERTEITLASIGEAQPVRSGRAS